MIVWPDPKANMNSAGKEGLLAFKTSGGSAALESSKERWRVVSWPWTSESPTRVILENDEHHQVVFSLAAGGIWRLSDNPMATNERSTVELDRDARGAPGERVRQPATRL